MNNILSIFILSFVFIILSGAQLSHAQDAQAIDYTKLESIGLLHADDPNSLGGGVYSHSNRSELVYLLKNIKHTSWIELQRTIKNFLLTAADSSAINNDIEITANHDLLTLRITALIRMGYNREAFELYTKASDGTLDEPLIRAGIFAMLFNKEKALACLEVKTSLEKYKGMGFWKEMNAYCTLSLSKEPTPEYTKIINNSKNKKLKSILNDENYRFEYDIKPFAALSFIERAVLATEDRIILPQSSAVSYKNIPPQHLSALLLQTNISYETKALLNIVAIKHGIESIDSLASVYDQILERYKDNPPKDNDWYRLAVLYDETKVGWIPKNRKDKIAEAFNIAQKHDDVALLPFLPALENMEVGDDLSLENAYRSTKLFLYSETSPPEKWLKNLIGLSYDDADSEKTGLTLLTSLYLMTNSDDLKLENEVKSSIDAFLLTNQKTAAFKNIIENIDREQNNGDKVRYIDTNDFDLDWNNRYTMPPYVILRTLDQSSKNQDTSVSLLLSAYILNKINSRDIYVGTIGDIVIALNDLGLKQLSHRIMAQIILKMEN